VKRPTSPNGTKRRFGMSAMWSLLGEKRTWRDHRQTDVNDPKETSGDYSTTAALGDGERARFNFWEPYPEPWGRQ
jgi:hypothetical protein